MRYLLILSFIIIIVLILYKVLVFWRRKRIPKEIILAKDNIKLALYGLLCYRYKKKYPASTYKYLSAGVVNYLFSDEPSNVEGQEFKSDNIELIHNEAQKISHDKYLCKVISLTMRALIIIKYMNKTNNPVNILLPATFLHELGIMKLDFESPDLPIFLKQSIFFRSIVNKFIKGEIDEIEFEKTINELF